MPGLTNWCTTLQTKLKYQYRQIGVFQSAKTSSDIQVHRALKTRTSIDRRLLENCLLISWNFATTSGKVPNCNNQFWRTHPRISEAVNLFRMVLKARSCMMKLAETERRVSGLYPCPQAFGTIASQGSHLKLVIDAVQEWQESLRWSNTAFHFLRAALHLKRPGQFPLRPSTVQNFSPV